MKKRYRIKYKSIIVLIIVIVGIYLILGKKDKKVYMNNITNIKYDDAYKLIEEYGLDIECEYVYSNKIDKDIIISQSIEEGTEISKGDKLILNISKGKIDKDKLESDGINELGNVPIMMYHGIKNMLSSETSYTGGNVDKDGYTRTSEAFRNDLEFYYENGYRMIKLSDYINGKIDVEYGYSPIILTFDDGNANNIRVTGKDSNGNIIIDPNSAVGIMEEFKNKHPDANVTAIFFITKNLFNQSEYNQDIINWLIENGYEIGNHTTGHNNFSNISTDKTQEVVGGMYLELDKLTNGRYSKIIALPYGSPYNKNHDNYSYILKGSYDGYEYETEAALRVGWEPEVSPFSKNFDKTFLKRCRAYDNNGIEFDIEMVFKRLEKTRYISDGDIDTIVTSSSNESYINNTDKEIIIY